MVCERLRRLSDQVAIMGDIQGPKIRIGHMQDDRTVFLDPDFVLEQVAKAPREFDLQARNPERSIHIGGQHMAFASVYGCPFVREGDTRREATMDDFENLVRLSQAFPELDSPGGTICEPNDRPLDSRHLDMVYALQTLSDKPYMGSVISGPNALAALERLSCSKLDRPAAINAPSAPSAARRGGSSSRARRRRLLRLETRSREE